MHILWILNVKFYNSLSFIIILVSFLYRETNPEEMENKKKGWLRYHHHLAPFPEESPLYQRYHHLLIPRPEKCLFRLRTIRWRYHRSIVSPGASSAPLTEDFTEVFPNLDINVTTPTKYPLMEELGVLNELVDNM